jgi:RNA polymerase sigma-70 factor (sigma-E family)
LPRDSLRDDEYEQFVRSGRGRLVATARLLTTGDGHLAEDLVQNALVRLYLSWERARLTNTDAYARRVLVNCFIDHRRRPWVRREHAADVLPDLPVLSDAIDDDLAAALLAALRSLPPRMRAAVVLRHVEDLPVEAVADALGCSTGTVKSQTARGVEKLRAQLATLPLRSGAEPGGNR